ncbi:MAG: preprotein translocase subunit SecG [Planctomycetes bacterium]|nr:preprotein translocase subunit SecG [Planctomycetota bacterium]
MLIVFQILFLLLCMLLVAVILVQPPKGEGFAAAFGGIGTETFFGTKTTQHINRFTIFLSIILLILVIVINIYGVKRQKTEAPQDTPPIGTQEK